MDTQVVSHAAITPSDRAYNLKFSGERQRANRIRHSCSPRRRVLPRRRFGGPYFEMQLLYR